MSKEETYKVRVHCDNCKAASILEIPKGQLVSNQDYPNCETDSRFDIIEPV